jgi:hypothetical protein
VSSQKNEGVNKILTTFVIFLIVHELPLFIFKLKLGNNQQRYFEQLSIYNEIRYETVYIMPAKNLTQRAGDIDLLVAAIHLILRSVFSIVFVYS